MKKSSVGDGREASRARLAAMRKARLDKLKRQTDVQKYDPGQKWYRVEAASFLNGSPPCRVCNLANRVGQIVYVDLIDCAKGPWVVTEDGKPIGNHIFIVHKDCFTAMLAVAPRNEYEEIQERLRRGGPLFE